MAIIVQIFILIATIASAWGIAHYQIQEGRKLNAENAGKNRIIYGVEIMSSGDKNGLKTKLDTGNYTILNAYANLGSFSDTIIILGRINP